MIIKRKKEHSEAEKQIMEVGDSFLGSFEKKLEKKINKQINEEKRKK